MGTVIAVVGFSNVSESADGSIRPVAADVRRQRRSHILRITSAFDKGPENHADARSARPGDAAGPLLADAAAATLHDIRRRRRRRRPRVRRRRQQSLEAVPGSRITVKRNGVGMPGAPRVRLHGVQHRRSRSSCCSLAWSRARKSRERWWSHRTGGRERWQGLRPCGRRGSSGRERWQGLRPCGRRGSSHTFGRRKSVCARPSAGAPGVRASRGTGSSDAPMGPPHAKFIPHTVFGSPATMGGSASAPSAIRRCIRWR